MNASSSGHFSVSIPEDEPLLTSNESSSSTSWWHPSSVLRAGSAAVAKVVSLFPWRSSFTTAATVNFIPSDSDSCVTDFKHFLENASSANELTAALKVIGELDEENIQTCYYTEEICDLILQKKDLITDSAGAAAVSEFFFLFSLKESNRPLLRTFEISNLVVNSLAPKISAGDSVYHLGGLICNIVQDKPSAELYSTTESFTAILSCFHRVTNPDESKWIATALHNILLLKSSSNKLLNDVPGIVEAFSALILHATTAEAANWIINALQNALEGNEQLQRKFASHQWIDNIKRMQCLVSDMTSAKTVLGYFMDPRCVILHLQNASTSHEFAAALKDIPAGDKFYNEKIRDLILEKKDLIADSASADAVVEFFYCFSLEKTKRSLLRTNEIRNLVINLLAPKVSAGDSVYHLGGLICNIVQDKRSAMLFSTTESFRAILSYFHRVSTPDGAGSITGALSNILLHNPSTNKLLNDIPAGVVEAFAALLPHATTDEAAKWIIITLRRALQDSEELQRKFNSQQWIDNIKSLGELASDKSNGKLLLGFLVEPESVITNLQSTSTSSEFAAAVKAIPMGEKCYNEKIRDLVLDKKHLIVDSVGAAAVSEFFYFFSREESNRPLLRTPDIRDLIINILAPKISAGNSVYHLGGMICNIVLDNPSAELYSTTESFKAILSCFHRVTTPDGSKWIATALNNILLFKSSSNKLLNDIPGVVEAFSALTPHATTEDVAEWIINALLRMLENNEELQRKFTSQRWIDKIKKMERVADLETKNYAQILLGYLVDPQSVITTLQNAATSSELAAAVTDIPLGRKFYNEQIRDLIRQKKDFISDSVSVDAVAEFFYFFSREESKRPLLRTPEIRDLIINILAPKVGAGKAVEDLGSLICNIVQDKPSGKLYSTTESFKAILSCFHRVTTSDDTRWISTALNNILLSNPSSNELFNNIPGVVEAFSALIPHATTKDVAEWVIIALLRTLENNEELQRKFTSQRWIDKIKKMAKLVSDQDNARTLVCYLTDLQSVIIPLQNVSTSAQLAAAVKDIPGGDKFYSDHVRDIILGKKDLITDSVTTDAVTEFLYFFSCEESRLQLLRTPEIRDLIINFLAPKLNAGDSVRQLGLLICGIVQDESSAQLFSTTESFKIILSCFHRVTTPEGAEWITCALYNIFNFDPSANKLLNDIPGAGEAFDALIPVATTDEAATRIMKMLRVLENEHPKFSSRQWVDNVQRLENLDLDKPDAKILSTSLTEEPSTYSEEQTEDESEDLTVTICQDGTESEGRPMSLNARQVGLIPSKTSVSSHGANGPHFASVSGPGEMPGGPRPGQYQNAAAGLARYQNQLLLTSENASYTRSNGTTIDERTTHEALPPTQEDLFRTVIGNFNQPTQTWSDDTRARYFPLAENTALADDDLPVANDDEVPATLLAPGSRLQEQDRLGLV